MTDFQSLLTWPHANSKFRNNLLLKLAVKMKL